MSDYKVIQTTAYSAITEVRFYEETIAHINESHPEVKVELPSISTAIEKAICNPTDVEQSDPEQHPKSYVYVDSETTDHQGQPLSVPVKIIEGTSALLKTVFFAEASSPQAVSVLKKGGGRG